MLISMQRVSRSPVSVARCLAPSSSTFSRDILLLYAWRFLSSQAPAGAVSRRLMKGTISQVLIRMTRLKGHRKLVVIPLLRKGSGTIAPDPYQG